MPSLFLSKAGGSTDEFDNEQVSATTYALAESLCKNPESALLLDEEASFIGRAIEAGMIVLGEAAPLKTTRKVVVKTKAQKVNHLQQQLALDAAKQNNDPMYAKYIKFRTLELGYRKQLEKKYKSRARTAAIKIASGGENPLKKPAPVVTKK